MVYIVWLYVICEAILALFDQALVSAATCLCIYNKKNIVNKIPSIVLYKIGIKTE